MGLRSPSLVSSQQEDPTSSPNQPLTEEQVELLSTFRAELTTEGHLADGDTLGTDDETLIRFLRARKFNLVQAKRMITQCLQWRHQVEGVGIDDLYRELDPFDFPHKQHVFKYWPMYYHRTDKLGRPINIQRFGSLDLTKLYSRVDKQAHFKSILVNCEVLTREILPACTYKKLLNHHQSSGSGGAGDVIPVEYPPDFLKITNAFCIVDLKGFSLTQFWQIKSIARTCFSISQDYYPETMGYLAIINAPKSFATIFKAIQPWLSKDTISKINILGDDYQTTLLEHVEPQNLPSYLGGQCECNADDLGNCNKNDPDFEQSPWLQGRDWKRESWRKFELGARDPSTGSSPHASEAERLVQRSTQDEQDEVELNGEMTQDGALIITTTKKSQETVNTPIKPPSQTPTHVSGEAVESETECEAALAPSHLAETLPNGDQPSSSDLHQTAPSGTSISTATLYTAESGTTSAPARSHATPSTT